MRQRRCQDTFIVEIEDVIVLSINKNDLAPLPAGHINGEELSIAEAAREHHVETSLIARAMVFIFSHEPPSIVHKEFLSLRKAIRSQPITL